MCDDQTKKCILCSLTGTRSNTFPPPMHYASAVAFCLTRHSLAQGCCSFRPIISKNGSLFQVPLATFLFSFSFVQLVVQIDLLFQRNSAVSFVL